MLRRPYMVALKRVRDRRVTVGAKARAGDENFGTESGLLLPEEVVKLFFRVAVSVDPVVGIVHNCGVNDAKRYRGLVPAAAPPCRY